MANIPNSMKDLIEQQVAEQVQQHLQSMNGQVQQLQSQASESIQQMVQVADQIQDQRLAAQMALDTLSMAMKNQMTASPDSLRPVMSRQLMESRPHYYASCYYEAMLRYWNAMQSAYILTTQVNFVSHAIALEINRATVEMSQAAYDAREQWQNFVQSLDDSIGFDDDMLGDSFNEHYYSITYVFPDSLTITASFPSHQIIRFGGLPIGTFVYINGHAFEIAANGFYAITPQIHGFDRVTSLINY